MLLALWAYDNVDKVSSKLMEAGDTVAISEVLVLPPRESCSKRVNLDSLKKSKRSKMRKVSLNLSQLFFNNHMYRLRFARGRLEFVTQGFGGSPKLSSSGLANLHD